MLLVMVGLRPFKAMDNRWPAQLCNSTMFTRLQNGSKSGKARGIAIKGQKHKSPLIQRSNTKNFVQVKRDTNVNRFM
jgi:hypothetical protein